MLLTSNNWCNGLPVWRTQTDQIADMREDLGVAQADKDQFAEVRVCGEVLKGVQCRSQESVCLI